MFYEIIIRSSNSGGIVTIVSGFETESEAEDYGYSFYADDESVWYEVSTQTY